MKANIVRDWKFDHKVKEHITVNGIFDLNLIPAAKQEGGWQKQMRRKIFHWKENISLYCTGHTVNHKSLGCLCWKSDPITANLHTNRTGYVSGEMIKFNVEVENRANTVMDGMFLVLKEVVTYTGWNVGSIEKDDNTEEKEVDRLTREEAISPRSSDSWQGESCRNYVLLGKI